MPIRNASESLDKVMEIQPGSPDEPSHQYKQKTQLTYMEATQKNEPPEVFAKKYDAEDLDVSGHKLLVDVAKKSHEFIEKTAQAFPEKLEEKANKPDDSKKSEIESKTSAKQQLIEDISDFAKEIQYDGDSSNMQQSVVRAALKAADDVFELASKLKDHIVDLVKEQLSEKQEERSQRTLTPSKGGD